MYDLPQIRAATDAWWSGLARAFAREGVADVPSRLHREGCYRESWTRGDLLLSQSCGYPLTHELRGRVALVATPCYAAQGCAGSDYRSVVIVHSDCPAKDLSELRGKRCVVSSASSHSGYNSLRELVARRSGGDCFFDRVEVSGSHLSSIALVAAGRADIAAIDCVTHALLKHHDPATLAGTRVLCKTQRAPGLPYITRGDAGPDLVRRLQNGVLAACADPGLADCRAALMIAGAANLTLDAYDRVVQMEHEAAECGFPELC